MKILLLHNRYQQRGGEDVVFETEGKLLSKNGHAVDELLFDNAEIKTFKDKILSAVKGIYNDKSAKELEAKIKTFKPDVIHVHNFFPIASPSIFFVAQKYKVPVVVTIHNYRLLCPSTFLFFNNSVYEKSISQVFPLDAIVKGVYHNSVVQTAAVAFMTGVHKLIGTFRNRVDKYIILTDFAKSKFAKSSLRLRENQMVVKSNSVNDLGVGYEYRDDNFLFVGRLSEEKGIQTLLEATKYGEFNLRIIGDGPLKGMVEEYANNNANITYLGFCDQKFIIEELKKCKALLLPSVWYEGFPMTILEAFSTGTPVIASRLGGPQEIIKDRVNGLHFDTGNAQDLAERIRWMQENNGLAWSLGKMARKTYELNYTPERNYQLLMNIYEEVIQNKNRGFLKNTIKSNEMAISSLVPFFFEIGGPEMLLC